MGENVLLEKRIKKELMIRNMEWEHTRSSQIRTYPTILNTSARLEEIHCGKWDKAGLLFAFLPLFFNLSPKFSKRVQQQITRLCSKAIVLRWPQWLLKCCEADEGFLPERHFFLWNIHMVTNKKPLRIFSLTVSDNTAIKFGNRWQSRNKKQKRHFKTIKIFSLRNKIIGLRPSLILWKGLIWCSSACVQLPAWTNVV